MKDDASNWVLKCNTYAADKQPRKKSRAPFSSIGVAATLPTKSTDVIGPLPLTPRLDRFILVATSFQ